MPHVMHHVLAARQSEPFHTHERGRKGGRVERCFENSCSSCFPKITRVAGRLLRGSPWHHGHRTLTTRPAAAAAAGQAARGDQEGERRGPQEAG